MVYNQMQPRQEHCATCGSALRRHSSSQVRVCPQPTYIQEYLKEHTGFEGTIAESDKVCYTCYRSHLVILGQRGQSSTDSDLLQLITAISDHLHASPCIASVSDLIEVATTQVAVDVGRKILEGNVLLLPDVHDSFKCHAQELASKYLQEEVNVVNRL